jgi:chromosome segregation ATPase
MAVALTTRFCIVLCAVLASQGVAVQVTPIEKVIVLLKDLAEKVATDGKREAAEYDKFACFCKEQADEKQYAMERSDAKIKDLSAEIEVLTSEITKLDQEIRALDEKIMNLWKKVDTKEQTRQGDLERYMAAAKDMSEAIDACSRAIEALKNSKADMRGAKLSTLETSKATAGLVDILKSSEQLANTPDSVAFLSKLDGAPKYEYHANEIIAMLQDLLATFKSMKKDLDTDEFNSKAAAEKMILGLSNQKTFSEKAMKEKAKIAQAKQEEKADRVDQRKDESDDYEADKQFKKRLGNECGDRAEAFDQRSRIRQKELTALSEATSELQQGAAPNFEANKKLVGLQKTSGVESSPATFVQINNVQHQASRYEAGLARVRDFLNDKADRSGSAVLAAIAVRVGVASDELEGANDHFAKVREIIQNLIDKLRKDAVAEADQKTDCNDGIKTSTGERDAANAKIEIATAKHTVFVANKNKLEDDNEMMTAHIAELKKALLEATELTKENVLNLEEQIDMTRAGAESVKLALTILRRFYSRDAYSEKDDALLQTGKYRPRDAEGFSHDRDGNTVGDLAPTTENDKYHGAQAESEGIVGILEVILQDFTRSTSQGKSDKAEAKRLHDDFEDTTNKDIKSKQETISKNEGKLAEIAEDIIDEEQALKDGNKLLASATEALAGWHTMCVEGEETWDERAQKREEEVEALKQALQILEEWKS